ncbi:hypothetical protein MML48_9g00000486 [Holotrichia oblita]|uniref:Uncharacterized protein n=1 Tax=Holotrichia oblita TaxID=644536 RepID=A0ACB9SND3_HOLOL|nr:hypothetical protein MML48_9g00000486 [Holotrichia oblita]
MPRKYIKKTNRTQISEQAMKSAVQDVIRKLETPTSAALKYNLKRTTIITRIKKKQNTHGSDSGQSTDDESNHYSSKYTSNQIFTEKQETELAEYFKKCSLLKYGLTYLSARKFAFQYAEINNIKCPTGWKSDKIAGVDWMYGFMKRNIEMGKRKDISREKRARIQVLLELGLYSHREIATRENVSHQTVGRVAKSIAANLPSTSTGRTGSRGIRKTSAREDKLIIRKALENRQIGPNSIARYCTREPPTVVTNLEETSDPSPSTENTEYVTPDRLRPLPKIAAPKSKKGGKSRIYTDTPEKDRLMELERNRNMKKAAAERKQAAKKIKKRAGFYSSDSAESERLSIADTDDSIGPLHEAQSDFDDIDDDYSQTDQFKLCDQDTIKRRDFVLVKFKCKTGDKFYIGCIIEDNPEQGNYTAEFLRRKSSTSFCKPIVPDIAIILRDDIELKMPAPIHPPGTSRSSTMYNFNIDLSRYNVS